MSVSSDILCNVRQMPGLAESQIVPHLMTIEEVADYLRLSKDTVYRMAQSGRIPASKVGTQWRFRQEDVDGWLDENKNVTRKGTKRGAGG